MHKLRYMALGGLSVFIGMLTAGMLMPSLVAQRDKFGEIECTGLRVVGDYGDVKVFDGNDQKGSRISLFGKESSPTIEIKEVLGAGRIVVYNDNGEIKVSLNADKQSGGDFI